MDRDLLKRVAEAVRDKCRVQDGVPVGADIAMCKLDLDAIIDRCLISGESEAQPEQPKDWPLQSCDARDWAQAFMRRFGERLHEIDEGLMITWFANALMCGFDEHARRGEAEAQQPNDHDIKHAFDLPADWKQPQKPEAEAQQPEARPPDHNVTCTCFECVAWMVAAAHARGVAEERERWENRARELAANLTDAQVEGRFALLLLADEIRAAQEVGR